MPNIANALKEEISRLARKELRANTESLKKSVASYRSEIAALKRRIDTLERQAKRTHRVVSKPVPDDEPQEPASNLRFRAGGFKAHRERLGLSAKEVGLLLGASQLSVYKWEQGKARPRAQHLEAIAQLRKMGKRDALQRLEELQA
jgi:DNA-binding transcriptional regulator YiaG